MTTYFDAFETQSQDEREARQLAGLRQQIERVRGFAKSCLPDIEVNDLTDLRKFPVLRKSKLASWQADAPPFGGIEASNVTHIFQSPGPIYEPGGTSADWWRFGRFLHACGIGSDDIIQNCFSYHLTPAGLMFENGARTVGAKILPAGIGQTALQARAARDVGVTAYAGTPDYLKVILEQADQDGFDLKIDKAAVSGGALFPSLRAYYADRGISCLQCYATADLGHIAYETEPDAGMITDEGVILEIVTPGTGDPVPEGEVGEIVVTTLNPDYPLLRFGTGDLSAILPGESACGRTNRRIKGWMGRADQTTKIKGMFVRPEQVADLVKGHAAIERVRVIADRAGDADVMVVRVESETPDDGQFAEAVQAHLKLKGQIEVVPPGSLPRDGIVIEDKRVYET
ncbi:phenylacetate--CoA ligase family protein [Aestuariibius insulae]|uniref:phenylacetate--CoA ligase family protein n=1 Tax=Aestuariibius insulae TaxID=2058287 RepID=UPI00345E6D20